MVGSQLFIYVAAFLIAWFHLTCSQVTEF